MRGTYAEYVVIPAGNAYPLPEGFDMGVAAAAGLVFHTAWHSLIRRGQFARRGERAGGGRIRRGEHGHHPDRQAGRGHGVRGRLGAEKLELAESLGADYLIDRSQDENWSKTVYQLTNKRGVDVVVDNVGTTFPLSFRAARKGGRILTVGNTGGPKFEIDNRFIFGKHLSLHRLDHGHAQRFRRGDGAGLCREAQARRGPHLPAGAGTPRRRNAWKRESSWGRSCWRSIKAADRRTICPITGR